jgi:hypothetical protein
MEPKSAKAIQLDAMGYTMLACRPFVTQIYDLMRPYAAYAPFLYLMLWVGLFFYFITSSDSGSYVDDLLASGGLSKPPPLQKIYWCCTEGAVASVLVGTSQSDNFANILKGLRSVSICAGMPLTILMCLMVPATYRALKREFGDKDIMSSKKFNTQLFDFCECYKPKNSALPFWGKGVYCLTKQLIALFVPGLAVFKALGKIDDHSVTKILAAIVTQLLWLAWFILHIVEVGADDSASLGWSLFMFMITIIGYTRWQMRQKYNIWGSLAEDLWVSLCMYPFVCAQVELHAENDGEGAPDYFHDLDALLAGESSTVKRVEEPMAATATSQA